MIKKSFIFNILSVCLLGLIFYGFSRLYYYSTDGFAMQHISINLPNNPLWETRSLTHEEKTIIDSLLEQEFKYLGKGCQSYVFSSNDNKYVLKFFKYQRMRDKEWLKTFNFLPFIKNYCDAKNLKKQKKREGVFKSWKLAFDHLSKETGILYVHLNKSNFLNKSVTIIDKVGCKHQVWIDDFQFMIQKKAIMLCDQIDTYMANKKEIEALNLLENLVNQILDEYQRGFADNDHALIQNTGVCDGVPLHVDVGQFVFNEEIKNKSFYLQELFTKTYKFRKWLNEKYPSLNRKFESFLKLFMDDFDSMSPLWRERMEIFQS